MNSQPEHYREQAQQMRDQAAAATLSNVRERCLRSAEAWEQMASRAERHRASVARTEARKAAEAAIIATDAAGEESAAPIPAAMPAAS